MTHPFETKGSFTLQIGKGHLTRYEVNTLSEGDVIELVGYSRETVNRHLQDLASENRIALSRGAIEVGSIEGLLGSPNH